MGWLWGGPRWQALAGAYLVETRCPAILQDHRTKKKSGSTAGVTVSHGGY
jgi:hypothetical protein